MGTEGSWAGAGGGGNREQFLVRLLAADFGKRRFLLYGTGNTSAFDDLRADGFDVVGCDISRDVVEQKKLKHGPTHFLYPSELVASRFDAVVAVEVFEHLNSPIETMSLLCDSLTKVGILCGTTNFYLGGPIEDINTPGYMSHEFHVAYWSESAMSTAAARHGMNLAVFQMERPGSVFPDEKYSQLWPNKRVFFMTRSINDHAELTARAANYPILPIRNP